MDTSIWSNFTGFQDQNVLNQNFSDTVIKSSEEQKATYQKVANACSSNWYKPIFDNEKKSETNSDKTEVKPVEVKAEVVPIDLKSELPEPKTTEALTIPPVKIEQNDLLNAVLVGLGVVFVLKILQ